MSSLNWMKYFSAFVGVIAIGNLISLMVTFWVMESALSVEDRLILILAITMLFTSLGFWKKKMWGLYSLRIFAVLSAASLIVLTSPQEGVTLGILMILILSVPYWFFDRYAFRSLRAAI